MSMPVIPGSIIQTILDRHNVAFEVVVGRVSGPSLLPVDPSLYTGPWVEDGDVLALGGEEYRYQRGSLRCLPVDWRRLQDQVRYLTDRVTETQTRHVTCDGDCVCEQIIGNLTEQAAAVHALYR